MFKWLIKWFDEEFPPIVDPLPRVNPVAVVAPEPVESTGQALIRRIKHIIDTESLTGGIGKGYPEYGHRYLVSMCAPHYYKPWDRKSKERTGIRTVLSLHVYEAPPAVQGDFFSHEEPVPDMWLLERKEIEALTAVVYEEDFNGITDMWDMYGKVMGDSTMMEIEAEFNRLSKKELRMKNLNPQIEFDFGD